MSIRFSHTNPCPHKDSSITDRTPTAEEALGYAFSDDKIRFMLK